MASHYINKLFGIFRCTHRPESASDATCHDYNMIFHLFLIVNFNNICLYQWIAQPMVMISISVIAFKECRVLAGMLIKSPLLHVICSLPTVILASPFWNRKNSSMVGCRCSSAASPAFNRVTAIWVREVEVSWLLSNIF